MNTYRFLAYPKPPLWANPGLQPLDNAAVTRSIEGAIVHYLEPDSLGQHIVAIALERQFHGDALDDIAVGLEAMGWTVSQAIVTEWVTETLTGATFGTGAGAAAGLSTKDPIVFLVLALLGMIAGAGVGSLFRSIRAQYQANRQPHYLGSGWELIPLPAQPDQSAQRAFAR
jgi:hypothetical protein